MYDKGLNNSVQSSLEVSTVEGNTENFDSFLMQNCK